MLRGVKGSIPNPYTHNKERDRSAASRTTATNVGWYMSGKIEMIQGKGTGRKIEKPILAIFIVTHSKIGIFPNAKHPTTKIVKFPYRKYPTIK